MDYVDVPWKRLGFRYLVKGEVAVDGRVEGGTAAATIDWGAKIVIVLGKLETTF